MEGGGARKGGGADGRLMSARTELQGEVDEPVSAKSFPIRPGVPTTMPTFVFWRYSMWSASLMCFAKSLPMSMSFVLYIFTSLMPVQACQR